MAYFGSHDGALVSPPLGRPSLVESASMMQTPSSSRKRAFDASHGASTAGPSSRPHSPASASSASSSPTELYHGYAPMPATPFTSPVRGGAGLGNHQTQFGAMVMSPPFGTPMQHPQLAAVMQTPSSAGSDARPDLKRRKTAPPGYFSPATPTTPASPEKRGNGKDGQEVWPPAVEEVFMEGASACVATRLTRLQRSARCPSSAGARSSSMASPAAATSSSRSTSRRRRASCVKAAVDASLTRAGPLAQAGLVAHPGLEERAQGRPVVCV